MPDDILDELSQLAYRERFHLSYAQLQEEPAEEVERALFKWSLEGDRDKLEAERQRSQQEHQSRPEHP